MGKLYMYMLWLLLIISTKKQNKIIQKIYIYRYYECYAPSYTIHGLALDRSCSDYQLLSNASASNSGGSFRIAGSNGNNALSSTSSSSDPINTREFLENSTNRILKMLNGIKGAPSVAIQAVPPSWLKFTDDDFSIEEEEREITKGREERAGTRELRALGR